MKKTLNRAWLKHKGTGVAAILGLGLAATTGCTYTAATRAKTNAALVEESRALTTAVVEALQTQPSSQRDVYTAAALAFAKQDQRVEGLPLNPFDMPALLQQFGMTNDLPEAVQERFAHQEKLIAKRAHAEARLVDLGIDAEEARNRRITRWTKFGVWGTALIGGAVGLLVFCPIALPIAGRLLAWLVGKIPSLASAFGVVSVKAFDAVVRGIEKSKSTPTHLPAAPTVPVANSQALKFSGGDSRRAQEGWIDQLQNHLSREMDAAHKALVRSRKTKLA